MHDYMTTIYKRVSSMMSPGLCKMKAIFVFVCLGLTILGITSAGVSQKRDSCQEGMYGCLAVCPFGGCCGTAGACKGVCYCYGGGSEKRCKYCDIVR